MKKNPLLSLIQKIKMGYKPTTSDCLLAYQITKESLIKLRKERNNNVPKP